MTKNEIYEYLCSLVDGDPGNRIPADVCIDEHDAGQVIFRTPVMRVGSADDPLWEKMKEPGAVGRAYRTPSEWLPGAKSVISFFFPFTDHIVNGNRDRPVLPGTAWMASYRYEERFTQRVCHRMEDFLRQRGIRAYAPYAGDEFQAVCLPGSNPALDPDLSFTSNWSERHAAYICGLGTFSLTRALITEKGMAGRFSSVITDLELPADKRDYTSEFEYCTNCGACAKRCPVHAITPGKGKDQELSYSWLSRIEAEYPGCDCCGKCMVGTLCSRRIPGRG